MQFLDFRTVLISYMITNLICVVVMYTLWRQNRAHSKGLNYWLADFVMQWVALVLIALRGVVPDAVSMISGVGLIIAGTHLLYIGLEKYVGKPGPQLHNHVLLALCMAIQIYFTLVTPSLLVRNLNQAVFLLLISSQCAALMLYRVDASMRPATAMVGRVMAAIGLVSLMRIMVELLVSPENDMFRQGHYVTALVMTYQMLFIALTFTLFLMVNSRLVAVLKNDFKVLKASEEAVRASEERLRLAEQESKSGHWELHLDSQQIIASDGATRIYGVTENQFDYAAIKGIPLPEYRPALDAAMKELIEAGVPYDIDFKIKCADSGVIKDVHSLATYKREKRTVFGTLQDITARMRLEDELERQAHVDYLTGLCSRGYFMERAAQELSRAVRYGSPLTLFMLDIDFFKKINDSYGHKLGDRVLIKFAEVCRQTLRQADIIGRIGGEEFAILLPETDRATAVEIAERLRESLAAAEVLLDSGRLPVHFTVSIGVTLLSRKDDSLDLLLNLADKAMYEAKETGRNKVCLLVQ
ncbi:MAG: diguanylate cyclase [Rhodoferax sp.]|nr:diguanylate cyclase [Rhodoferax sp.]